MIPTTFTSDHGRGLFSREGACERSPNSNINNVYFLAIFASTCLAEHTSIQFATLHHSPCQGFLIFMRSRSSTLDMERWRGDNISKDIHTEAGPGRVRWGFEKSNYLWKYPLVTWLIQDADALEKRTCHKNVHCV